MSGRWRNSWKSALKRSGYGVLLIVGVGVVLCVAQWSRRIEPNLLVAPSRAPTSTHDRLINYRLSDEYLAWYQLLYINGARLAGSTDIDDLVKEIGFEQTVQRYLAPYRIVLDYAAAHPDLRVIPPGDLERIAQLQYEHLLAIVRSSRRWIDYKDDNVRKGILASYAVADPALIRFFQKLLAAPASRGRPEFKTLISTTLTRQEYADVMEQTDQSTRMFYAALKQGVTWYAPWAPFVKFVLERSCLQDIAAHKRTVDEIYVAGRG
jgi:hypothetical protein